MPPQGRLGDLAQIPADAHGCPACPHPAVGPAIAGSADVLTNGLPSLRVGDQGIHAACCGPNMWSAKTGSATVLINGRKAHRLSDMTKHCGGMGQLIIGSPNVLVGDSSSSGGGAGQSTTSSTGGSAQAPPPAAPESPPPASASEPPAPEQKPPKQAPAKWSLQYEDGRPVKGFRSKVARATQKDEQELHPDGSGRNEMTSMDEEEGFSVVPMGTQTVNGHVRDPDGNPVANAQVWVERAYGPPVDLVTDGSGSFKTEGLLEEEPFEVVVRPTGKVAEGRFVDEKGRPVPARAAAWLDRSQVVELPVKSDGTYQIKGRPPGDHYDLLFVASELAAEGRFTDEFGAPIPGVRARARLASGRTVEVVSDANGRYRIPGMMPEETYSMEILSGSRK